MCTGIMLARTLHKIDCRAYESSVRRSADITTNSVYVRKYEVDSVLLEESQIEMPQLVVALGSPSN